MQNHQQQEPPPMARKPPRPPPISISQPSNPNPSAPPDPRTRSSDPDSFHSPQQYESPGEKKPDSPSLNSKNGGAIVAIEKFYSPLNSPFALPVTPPMDAATPDTVPSPHRHQIVRFNTKEDAPPQSGGGGGERKRKVRFGHGGLDDIDTGKPPYKKGDAMSKLGLGIRVFEVAFCLVSFSVMATDKTQGWTGDSFGRYKEYRFCLTVNIIGFVYAGFQAYDLAFLLATGDHVIKHTLRYQFDFLMDQIMAYLLISASSAAATRVVDWELNWGKDAFTEKASASVSMAFLAFFAFAMSSLVSGYNLCNGDLS